MKHLCLIAGSILTIGFMTSCNETKSTASHSVTSDAEKAALEAEQAELELSKLAEMQKQIDTKATKNAGKQAKSGGRQPASAAPAKVVKHDAPAKKVVEKKAVEKKAVEKKVEHKIEAKKPVEPAKPVVKEAKVEAAHASPQALAKKEMESEISVFAKKEAKKEEAKVETKEAHAPAAHQIGAVAALDKHHVAAAPAPAPASVKSQSVSRSSVYVVQVGAFRVKDNALKLEEKLKGSGFPVRMKEVNHSKNGMLYVVQFEPTPNRIEANGWREQVKAKASIDAQLVSRPD